MVRHARAGLLVACMLVSGCIAPVQPQSTQPNSGQPSSQAATTTSNAAESDTLAPADVSPEDISPADVSIDMTGLPWSWAATLVATTPYTDAQPPGPTGMPEHVQIDFTPAESAEPPASAPILYLIPVNAYRAMWDEAGNPAIRSEIDRIYQWTQALPSPAPTSGAPALPPEQVSGFNDLVVQAARTGAGAESASRSGYRFVGRWAQDANPVTNQGLRYVYQGFTNDGAYLVTFFYPVTSPALLNLDELTAADWDSFNSDPQGFIAAQAATLNALPPEAWEPDLKRLDAAINSLRITGMPATGLYNGPWQWVAVSSSSAATAVANPQAYSVTYHPTGMLDYVTACQSGSADYTQDGGMVGTLRTQLPAATLPSCGDNSQSQQLYDALRAAQDFNVLPGGLQLNLNLPAGGPVYQFADAEAVPAP